MKLLGLTLSCCSVQGEFLLLLLTFASYKCPFSQYSLLFHALLLPPWLAVVFHPLVLSVRPYTKNSLFLLFIVLLRAIVIFVKPVILSVCPQNPVSIALLSVAVSPGRLPAQLCFKHACKHKSLLFDLPLLLSSRLLSLCQPNLPFSGSLRAESFILVPIVSSLRSSLVTRLNTCPSCPFLLLVDINWLVFHFHL